MNGFNVFFERILCYKSFLTFCACKGFLLFMIRFAMFWRWEFFFLMNFLTINWFNRVITASIYFGSTLDFWSDLNFLKDFEKSLLIFWFFSVLHFFGEVQFLGENMYWPFRDKKKYSSWARIGTNYLEVKRSTVPEWELIPNLRSKFQSFHLNQKMNDFFLYFCPNL